MYGYHGAVLQVDLSAGTIEKRPIAPEDAERFVGGRGLGAKLLWDELRDPGVDALSPQNPLIFTTGPLSGLPIPSVSRTSVVTKSPVTAPLDSPYPSASTLAYANMGGFFGPEIRFAGYDEIVVKGAAETPVYLRIDDDRVEIKDAGEFWGMGTDDFDRRFIDELGDRSFETCYIGPAGEHQVPTACIVNTAARAAGRGGGGAVMGSKNLKGIAVRGSQMPPVHDHARFLELLEHARGLFRSPSVTNWARDEGTTWALEDFSNRGIQAVRNFREGSFAEAANLGVGEVRSKLWARSFACYMCPLACKKSGVVRTGPHRGTLVHDGPEFETGTMLGANLMIGDLEGLMRCIFVADDLGIDAIAAGNVIGFLMEAYEKGHIDRDFLDGVDLRWGNVEATLEMLRKIAYREGVGDLAAQGFAALEGSIGQHSGKYAMHVKGQGLAAHNVYRQINKGVSYASSNRGACHLNGQTVAAQNEMAMIDSLGVCFFAAGTFGVGRLGELLQAITGVERTTAEYRQAGERIFNLEKMFNWREGFRRADDRLPDRFFEEAPTTGPTAGAVLDRGQFQGIMDRYYASRGWDTETSRPTEERLQRLGLDFALE